MGNEVKSQMPVAGCQWAIKMNAIFAESPTLGPLTTEG